MAAEASRWVRRKGSGLLLAALAVLGLSGCSRTPERLLIPPPPATSSTVPEPAAPDYSAVALDPVPGQQPPETVEVLGGEAALSGVVLGPDGPVPGATVLLERLVGDMVGRLEVTTDEAGSWRTPPPTGPPPARQGIIGGRYRVRAWRTPDFALTTPQILFLDGKENRDLTLEVLQVSDTSVSLSSYPDPPLVGSVVSFSVQALIASVDSEGVVHSMPVSEASLDVGAGWDIVSDVTFAEPGQLMFELLCQAAGPNPVVLIVDQGLRIGLPVQECVVPTP